MSFQQFRDTVDEIADSEVRGHSRLRMLTLALVAGNWVTLQMLVLYITDSVPAAAVARISVTISVVVVSMHLLLSRLPAIARGIQWVGDIA